MMALRAGLRIDVDTFSGTRDGVPALLKLLGRYGFQASFFFSVGPDNMGRHLWRLHRPAFLGKMLRSSAPGLYGWSVLLRGTLWPGPQIGAALRGTMRATAAAGHETGLHAWDHHAWQMHLERMSPAEVGTVLRRGVEALTEILGRVPTCSAAPGWRCTDAVLLEKNRLPFVFNSDCRGSSVFRPVLNGTSQCQVQVPSTLPTYDELIGSNGITDSSYNEHVLSMLRPDALNVLTVHAEVEGRSRAALFEQFLGMARARGVDLVPLGELIDCGRPAPAGAIGRGHVPGREGWVACQQ